MVRDTTPTSYVIDIDPHSRHLTLQIFLSSEAIASSVFPGPFLGDVLVLDSFHIHNTKSNVCDILPDLVVHLFTFICK